MSINSILSKMACGSIEERPGYTGKKAVVVVGDRILTLEVGEDSSLMIDGVPAAVEDLPRKADRVILQN